MKKKFPVSVFSVKEYGSDDWLQDQLKWQVSRDEFFSLRTDIYNTYVNCIHNNTGIENDVLLVLYKLILEYTSFIHALSVHRRLHDSGLNIAYSKSDFYYKSLSEKNKNINGLFESYKSKLLPELPPFHRRLEGRLKTPFRTLKHFGIGSSYFSSHRSTPYIAYGLPEQELIEFAASQKRKIRFFYPFPVKLDSSNASSNELLIFEKITKELIKSIETISIKYGIR